jgi:DNA-directed RNA polymerase specialized sigma24 family protein
MDGHSLEEVAELLRLPVGTVKSRLYSARKQLAEKLR